MKIRFGLAVCFLSLLLAPAAGAQEETEKAPPEEKTTIVVERFRPEGGAGEAEYAFEFMKEYPHINVIGWTSLRFQPGVGTDTKLMAFAGKTAPDVLQMVFHIVGYYAEQGFLYPLNEYIGDDLNGDGSIDEKDWRDTNGNGKIDPEDEGLRWDEWLTIDPYYRRVGTIPDKDGIAKIYCLPFASYNLGMIYRLDLVRRAGLDPKYQPQTWDELFYWLQRLTDPKAETGGLVGGQGIWGFGTKTDAQAIWEYQPWFWASGGDLVRIGKKNPKTGKIHWWPKEELKFIDPETGEFLANEPSIWKANFASEESLEALDFIWKLRWCKWIKNPKTGEPINLADEVIERGWVNDSTGQKINFGEDLNGDGSINEEDDEIPVFGGEWIRHPETNEMIFLADEIMKRGWVTDPKTKERVAFSEDDVIEGVVLTYRSVDDQPMYRFLDEGKVACLFGGLGGYLMNMQTNPASLGFMPYPAGPHGKKALFRTPNFKGLNSQLAEDKEKRDAAWLFMKGFCGKKGRVVLTRLYAQNGYARFAFPEALEEAGLTEYIEEIPKHWRLGYEDVFQYGRTEPFTRFWWPVMTEYMGHKLVTFMLTDKGFDYRSAAKELQEKANLNFFMYDKEKELQPYRKLAWTIFIIAFAGLSLFIGWLLHLMSKRVKAQGKSLLSEMAGSRTVGARFAPWIILAPAVLLVLTFAYFPLVRGAVMAFQDYKITLPSKFIGLDNFILVFLDKSFWVYLMRTIEFSFFTLLFGFTSPIILAILLSEIPIGKVFFRVVFYLPTISSAIVVMLVWKLMYEPTEFGFLNQLVDTVRAGLVYIRVDDAAAFLHLSNLAEWLQSTKPVDWLGNPYTVMICVIIPSVWAAMGAACLIYLAALKTVPDDLYDAAAIDGAGIWGRMRNVTLPFLKPLIIINFVGAFIGTFLGMGNIFVMTGGGPGDRTMVLSLAIWYRAFATLQFGIATAMAWVLGSLLIGFTVYQLKFLQKVEFRRLQEN